MGVAQPGNARFSRRHRPQRTARFPLCARGMAAARGHQPAGPGPHVFRPHAHGRIQTENLESGLPRRRPVARSRAYAGTHAHRRHRNRRLPAAQTVLGQSRCGRALHLLLSDPHSHHRPPPSHPGRAQQRSLRNAVALYPVAGLGLRHHLPESLHPELLPREDRLQHRRLGAGPGGACGRSACGPASHRR